MNETTIHNSDTELMPTQTIESMVMAYTDAVADTRESYACYARANARLNAAFGTYTSLPYQRHECDSILHDLRRTVWGYIVRQTGALECCSVAKRKEIENQIEKGEVPEITVENVSAFLEGLRGNIPGMLQEAIKEVFDILRPGCRNNYYNQQPYKTNEQSTFQVGERMILEWFLTPHDKRLSTKLEVSYSREQHITAIDNVFHLLDGRGVAKYPDDLLTKMTAAFRAGETEVSTEYFHVKGYKKGTLHIDILRDDLRKELNRIAGGGAIRDYQPKSNADLAVA